MFSGRGGGTMPPPPPWTHPWPLSSIILINWVYPTARNLQCYYHSINWANQTLIIPYMSASSLKITPFRAISNTLLHIFVVYLYSFVLERKQRHLIICHQVCMWNELEQRWSDLNLTRFLFVRPSTWIGNNSGQIRLHVANLGATSHFPT